MSEEEEYENNEEELVGSGGITGVGGDPQRPPVVEPAISFENEWVRFLDRLSEDSSLGPLVNYIESVELTDRAKTKLQIYIITLLDKEFAISRLENSEDLMKLMDDKYRLDADLPLGLTRFDQTPEFQHIIGLVRIKFGIKIRRSMGAGFERKIIATTRSENVNEERVRTKAAKSGTISKLKGMFGE